MFGCHCFQLEESNKKAAETLALEWIYFAEEMCSLLGRKKYKTIVVSANKRKASINFFMFEIEPSIYFNLEWSKQNYKS
jgi:hypothetical protein